MVAIVASLLAVDLIVERIALRRTWALVEQDLTEALGLDVVIRGDLRVDVLPQPRLIATELTVANLPDRPSPHLLRAGRIELELDLSELLFGRIEIDELNVADTEIRIDGRGDGSSPSGPAPRPEELLEEGAGDPLRFSVENVEFDDLRIVYQDATTATVTTLRFDRLIVEADDLKSPLSLRAEGALDEKPFEISGDFGPIGEYFKSTTPFPVALRGRLGAAWIEIEGDVESPQERRGFNLAINGRFEDPAVFLPMEGAAQPDIGPLRFSGRLTDRSGVLALEDLSAATSEDAALRASIQGSVGDLAAFRGVDLRATLAATNLRDLEPFAEWPLPEAGPLRARARLRDEDDRLAVDEIDVQLGDRETTWVEIKGSVLDVNRLQNVLVRAEFGAADLHHLRPYLEHEPPDVGPIRGSAHLSDRDGTLGVEHFEIRGGHEGLFEIDVVGTLDDVIEADEISIEARLDARDLLLLGEIFDAELPAIGPIAFAGRLTGSNERLAVEELTLKLDDTELTGNLSGSVESGERPKLTARLASPHIHLDDIGVEPASEAEVALASERLGPWWVGAEPLPFEKLRTVDLDLVLRADRISGRQGLDIRSARATVRLDDGELDVSDASCVYDGGRFEARLLVDTTTPRSNLAVIANVKGFDLAVALAQVVENPQGAGLVDASVDLQSRGHSIDAIRSNLSGHVDVLVREGYAATRFARAMEMSLLDAIIPFESPAEVKKPSCFGIELEIEDGVAQMESLVLRSSQVTVEGEGTIELGDQQLDLHLTPTRTDPGLLGATVGVRIQGPIDAPSIIPVKRSIATSAVRGIFSNAMRPDNLLLRPFRHEIEIDASDCDTAR